ncbi:MAG: glycine cleavage system protein GcvH [Anaerolineae bacterium]|nr:glycine cleavage system protein GcvH [Anaerolineae bacterium]
MSDWKTPADVKFTDSDEWVRVEGDEATIGLSDYAQDQLNDIVYVELPEVGDSFGKGDSFGTVESVKAASEMHMPVGGTVTAINEALEDEPEAINTDPFGGGWFIKVTIADKSELDGLMDAAAYAKYCDERD